MLADHHNVYDTTEIDIFFIALIITCVTVAYFINKLLKQEEQDITNE